MARDQGVYSISRRSFCCTLAGVLVAPVIAIAQASKVRRIGVLEPFPDTAEVIWKRDQPLRELGWVEGQNLRVERRYDNGHPETQQALAEELVRGQVEIIVTWGTSTALAAKRATVKIPIVFTVGDPVLLGLVASLARPGGNLTGISQAGPETIAKNLSVLKELLPRLQRIGVLWDAVNPYARASRRQFEQVCQALGLAAIIVEIGAASDIGGVITQLAQRRVQAVVLPSHDIIIQRRFEIVDASINHHLPTMAQHREIVTEAGALFSYQWSPVEHDRMRADYIDRILRGAKPADLPVQQPTKFELAINLKTAKALGLTIPKELLLRADEVIQ